MPLQRKNCREGIELAAEGNPSETFRRLKIIILQSTNSSEDIIVIQRSVQINKGFVAQIKPNTRGSNNYYLILYSK